MEIKVVTICGSMKFASVMQQIATELEKKNGWSVIQCCYGITQNTLTKQEMDNIVNAHWKKIDISDAIYVVNIGGYIGNATKNEIEYAKQHGKEIIYHESQEISLKDLYNKLNIHTPKDLFNFLEKNMKYGFTYKIFTDLEPNFQENVDKLYKLRLGKDFVKNGYGVCWDFCEFERDFFISQNIEHECYFVDSFIKELGDGPTHTFALYKEGNKWFWFEFSWSCHKGIHPYNSKEEAIKDIAKKFKSFYDNKCQIKIYKTEKVTKRLDVFEFVEHCINGEQIKF